MEQLPNQQNRDIVVVATQPRIQGGGTYGWWEEKEGGPARLDTLRKSFLIGASDEEACYLAGITKQQLYYYCKNINIDFSKEKEELKLNAVFVARKTIVKAIATNADMAWRFLAKKMPKEFGENSEGGVINNFGTINTQINQEYFDVPDNADELLDGDTIIPAKST